MNTSIKRHLGATALGLVILTSACSSDSNYSSTSTPSTSGSTAASSPATSSASGSSTAESSSSGSTPSAGSGSTEFCDAREELKTSIEDLKGLDIVSGGTAGLTTALTTVKENLAAVKSSAPGDLKPQITAFQTSLDTLESAVKDIGTGGVAAVVTAATGIATAGNDLLTSLDAVKCN